MRAEQVAALRQLDDGLLSREMERLEATLADPATPVLTPAEQGELVRLVREMERRSMEVPEWAQVELRRRAEHRSTIRTPQRCGACRVTYDIDDLIAVAADDPAKPDRLLCVDCFDGDGVRR